MLIEKILNSQNLSEIIDTIEEFCRQSYLRVNDSDCLTLKETVENAEGNDILTLLSSYLESCEDGYEIIDALYEFIGNCKGFVEADEEMTHQVTKAEFEAILDDCETKCLLQTCIEENHILKVVETELYNENREFCLKFKENNINLLLPRIDINTEIKKYISEELGMILYGVLNSKLPEEYIRQEMKRYIPEIRNTQKTTKQLFKEYFYYVVSFKKQKPNISSEYDEHSKSIIISEFFKKIIVYYLKE